MKAIHRYCVESKMDMFYEGKHPEYKERMDQDLLAKLGYEIAKFIQQNPDKDIIVKIVESDEKFEYKLGEYDIRIFRKEARFYDMTNYDFYERRNYEI